MDRDEWAAKLAKLQIEHSGRKVTHQKELRLAMAELWELARTAPQGLTRAYRGIPDHIILAEADRMADPLTEGRLVWNFGGSDRDVALAIGGQMRSLDTELAGRPAFAATPTSTSSFYCEAVNVYVIPRRDAKVTDRPAGPGNGFGRRGTPHHRILPRSVGDYAVELVWKPLFSAGPVTGHDHCFGAALMPGMELKRDPAREGWVAGTATCPDEEHLLTEQVEGSYAEPVMASVWPELSMPPDRLARLQAALHRRSRHLDGKRGPAIVAAGSWHEDDDAGLRNIMRVLDKTGKCRVSYTKRLGFMRGDVAEPIIEGTVIPVVVNNDALITFAICLDFCERELRDLPYHELDVDLVLVPSFGNETTMKGHEGNAGDMAARFGSRAFVVQQHNSLADPVGYVLPADRDAVSAAEMRGWSTRTIQFT